MHTEWMDEVSYWKSWQTDRPEPERHTISIFLQRFFIASQWLCDILVSQFNIKKTKGANETLLDSSKQTGSIKKQSLSRG